MDDEIKLHFSNHEAVQINGMNTRCYPETFYKELANGAKSGYTELTIIINSNEYQLKRLADSQQWLPDSLHKDLETIASIGSTAI